MIFEDSDVRAAAVLGSQSLGQLNLRMSAVVMVNEPADKSDHNCRIRDNIGSKWTWSASGIGIPAKEGNNGNSDSRKDSGKRCLGR
jgi:hypothetical protein